MIYIRVDANHEIGLGHVMRCLSIADAMANLDNGITFILADDSVSSFIENRGYTCYVLNSCYKDLESEVSKWPKAFPDIVLVDSYYVTENYLLSIKELLNKKKKGKVFYIDDTLSFAYPVDGIVNYNIYADKSNYEYLYKASHLAVPSLILGPEYTPLRAMFRGIQLHSQPNEIKDILISTGGSDELHLAVAFIEYLLDKACNVNYHFLIGALNTDKDKIKKMACGRPNIIIHENVTDMMQLISGMDIAISAAGSTLYEICACGVPIITYSFADNQIPGAESFDKLDLAYNMGDLRKLEISTFIDSVFSTVGALSQDYRKRVDIGHRMQALIDGYGAERMAKKIFDAVFA